MSNKSPTAIQLLTARVKALEDAPKTPTDAYFEDVNQRLDMLDSESKDLREVVHTHGHKTPILAWLPGLLGLALASFAVLYAPREFLSKRDFAEHATYEDAKAVERFNKVDARLDALEKPVTEGDRTGSVMPQPGDYATANLRAAELPKNEPKAGQCLQWNGDDWKWMDCKPPANLHTLSVSLSKPCWVRVSRDGETLAEGNKPAAWTKFFSFAEKTKVEVRAGCPGAVMYEINGVLQNMPNESGTPQQSEVVHLEP